jgi:hypothetical protein
MSAHDKLRDIVRFGLLCGTEGRDRTGTPVKEPVINRDQWGEGGT